MKKVVKQKTVDYAVYVAEDGKEFTDKNECRLHERKLNGEIIECPNCHGEGRTTESIEYEDHHTGVLRNSIIKPTCRTCGGRGYLEKTVTWK